MAELLLIKKIFQNKMRLVRASIYKEKTWKLFGYAKEGMVFTLADIGWINDISYINLWLCQNCQGL